MKKLETLQRVKQKNVAVNEKKGPASKRQNFSKITSLQPLKNEELLANKNLHINYKDFGKNWAFNS